MNGLSRSTSFAAALLEHDPQVAVKRGLHRRLLLATALVLVAVAVGPLLAVGAGVYDDETGALASSAIVLLAFLLLAGHVSRALERSDARRRRLQDNYRRLVEQLPLVVYVDELSDNSANIYTSPQVEALLGYTVEDWVSDPELFVRILHEEDRDRVLAEVKRSNDEQVGFDCDYRLIAKDGRVVWVHDEASVYRDGDVAHAQGYMVDISRRRLAEEELRALAVTDPLTDLPNRRQLLEQLGRSEQAGLPQSLLFLDIDDFKTFNDSLGHRAGDLLLVEVATRLARCVGPDEMVARLGGDEFAVATPVTDRARLDALGRRLLTEVVAPIEVEGRELWLGASIGIATGRTADELLRDADLAMYRAKAQGGSSVAFFAPHLHESAERRLGLSADLRRTLLYDELELVYQPTFDLRDGGIEGVEALLRWHHPALGLVPPAEFVPIAEEQGSIVEIGRFVLDAACRQAALWSSIHHRFVMGVNVSGRQLRDPAFADDVLAALAAHKVSPELLRLELTESVLVQANDTARRSVAAVCEVGVQLAIDDFGTGNSWIGQLQEFEPHVIKLDRSLIAGVESGDARLLRGTVALARELGVKVVAEGIEEVGQLAVVRDAGCDVGQGFLLATPLPAAAVGPLLERDQNSPPARLRLA
jgi:diguanylate cyclase (GGDEF)-like protein/PAS domain S-box-containing protein